MPPVNGGYFCLIKVSKSILYGTLEKRLKKSSKKSVFDF